MNGVIIPIDLFEQTYKNLTLIKVIATIGPHQIHYL